MLSTTLIALLIFPLLLVIAGVFDLTTMTIPNWINGLLLISFPALALFAGLGWPVILQHLGSAGILLAIGFAMFAFGWIGGGDAKMFAAMGLWCGMDVIFPFLVIAAFFGGVLTVLILIYRYFPIPAFFYKLSWLTRLHDPDEGVPYGIALAGAGLVLYSELTIYPSLALPIFG